MRRLLIPFIFGLMAALLGCTEEPPSPVSPQTGENENSTVPSNLQNLIDSLQIAEPDLDNRLIDPTQPPPILTDSNYDVYAVTFIWGHLPFGPTFDSPPLDWSGSIYVNGEAKGEVLRTIAFEPGQDSLLPPPEGTLIAWASVTTYSFDGLATLIALDKRVTYITAPWLTFDTDPIKLELGFDELAHLNAFYPVDNQSGVLVISRKVSHIGCPHGSFDGTWTRDENTMMTGHFSAVWMNPDGVPFAKMEGQFGPNTNSLYGGMFEGELFGAANNKVVGKVRGRFYYDDLRMCPMCGDAHGIMSGYVYDLDGRPLGRIEGEFGDWTTPAPQEMPLHGKWRLRCNNAHDAFTDD